MERNDYTLTVYGCDDKNVVGLSLTAVEAATLEYVVFAINEASTYGCEPTATLVAGAPEPEED